MATPVSLVGALARPGSRIATIPTFRSFFPRGIVSVATADSRWATEKSRTLIQTPGLRPLPERYTPLSLYRTPLEMIHSMVQYQQRRLLNTNGVPRSLLATREATANRNPNNATAQNAFYQVLLKANLPNIVVERYESGVYASNDAVDAAYFRALDLVQKGGAAGSVAIGNVANVDKNSALQGAAQAAVGRTGGTTSTSTVTASEASGSGQRITVLVQESWGIIAWKWGKLILSIVIVGYVALAVLGLVYGVFDSFNDMFQRNSNKNKPNEVRPEAQTTRFSDVHGCDEAKEELQDAVAFLKDPTGFNALGGKLPKGVLLIGPPGTGKTLLARAVAGEAGVPFFYMSGSEFDEVWVGLGAKRVRDLFAAAKAKSPSIIFIDELDAVGSKRQSGDRAYLKQTLNQLLTEMDGFETNTGVIVIAATNHAQVLDKALTRPGRFDRHVVVGLPDARGRLAILKHHAKKIKLGTDVRLDALAARTSGLSGADLENILNQAAVHAGKLKAKFVDPGHLEWASDKVMMGAERRMIASPKEKLMTAYHEAGHALVLLLADQAPQRLHKVTILARGQSLGHTAFLPEMDKHSYSMADYTTLMRVNLGGKAAEELVFGHKNATSGASSDLSNATKYAFRMVGHFGMSQKLGPVSFLDDYDKLSSETRNRVEMEVQRILGQAQEEAIAILTEKRKELDLLAQALVKYETLDSEEVMKVIRGESLPNRVALPADAPLALPIPDNGPEALPPTIPGRPGGSPSPPPPPPPPGAA